MDAIECELKINVADWLNQPPKRVDYFFPKNIMLIIFSYFGETCQACGKCEPIKYSDAYILFSSTSIFKPSKSVCKSCLDCLTTIKLTITIPSPPGGKTLVIPGKLEVICTSIVGFGVWLIGFDRYPVDVWNLFNYIVPQYTTTINGHRALLVHVHLNTLYRIAFSRNWQYEHGMDDIALEAAYPIGLQVCGYFQIRRNYQHNIYLNLLTDGLDPLKELCKYPKWMKF